MKILFVVTQISDSLSTYWILYAFHVSDCMGFLIITIYILNEIQKALQREVSC